MQARGGWVSWVPSVAIIGALGLTVLGNAPVDADGTWLDGPISEVSNWNVPGMTLPSATGLPTDPTMACPEMVRPAETQADLAVMAAGCKLVGIYRSGWSIATVDGTAGFDHMCRMSTWMEFVFVDGIFAGTTSPGPMHVGSDGDSGVLSIGSDNLSTSTFIRYQARDPHCCPSGHSAVHYRIDRTDAGPVLVPIQATTFWQQP